MPTPLRALALAVVVSGITLPSLGQDDPHSETRSGRTMKPVITGRQYAVTAMKHQATEAAVRILEKGGNAFDAAVAGQAVLALVDPANNGYGSDAVVLVYDAAARKVWSVNAEGTAPRLATIEWYQQHNGGKLPDSDGLLSATVPGVVDAWYTMLDRWGTMTLQSGAAAGAGDSRRRARALPRAGAVDGREQTEEVSVERESLHAWRQASGGGRPSSGTSMPRGRCEN